MSSPLHTMVRLLAGVSTLGLLACQSITRFSLPASTSAPKTETPLPAHDHTVQQRLWNIVQQWIGVPYCQGGNSSSCIDCSGFVQKVFAELGVQLPRTSSEQARVGNPIQPPLLPGDLVIVAEEGRTRHVAIYLGDGRIVHASRSRGVVVEPFSALLSIGSHLHFRRLLIPSTSRQTEKSF